ncbi:hypothetical protein [Caproiciproducens galactitolivorans]|uniref:Secreted protein n=1 Tax=Caproiciproducens galactitolivorans TaxID=642589 RepID=A0ABT4BRA2_9FIRM|nr:hypothetical protein [Caproiciproducens galactitolivorans]MCY1713416.1 hypothetical protein [Caproiciproducens galactitolivorans]
MCSVDFAAVEIFFCCAALVDAFCTARAWLTLLCTFRLVVTDVVCLPAVVDDVERLADDAALEEFDAELDLLV